MIGLNSEVVLILGGLNSDILLYCDPSLEPSLREGSNEGSQCMFS